MVDAANRKAIRDEESAQDSLRGAPTPYGARLEQGMQFWKYGDIGDLKLPNEESSADVTSSLEKDPP